MHVLSKSWWIWLHNLSNYAVPETEGNRLLALRPNLLVQMIGWEFAYILFQVDKVVLCKKKIAKNKNNYT